jgi:hypothetical protein
VPVRTWDEVAAAMLPPMTLPLLCAPQAKSSQPNSKGPFFEHDHRPPAAASLQLFAIRPRLHADNAHVIIDYGPPAPPCSSTDLFGPSPTLSASDSSQPLWSASQSVAQAGVTDNGRHPHVDLPECQPELPRGRHFTTSLKPPGLLSTTFIGSLDARRSSSHCRSPSLPGNINLPFRRDFLAQS